MARTIVEKVFEDFTELLNYLDKNSEISLRSDADNNFKKVLILTVASYFEAEILKILTALVHKKTNNDKLITSFMRVKALDRQYHTFFNWKENNANSFFGMFGDDFREKASSDVKSDENLDIGIKSFLEIGRLRNELIHRNFGVYTIDKTAREVMDQYYRALRFLDYLSENLS